MYCLALKLSRSHNTSPHLELSQKRPHSHTLCPINPGITLMKDLKKVISVFRPVNEKVIVFEHGGMPITTGLNVKDLMCLSGCIFGDPDCVVQRCTKCDRTGAIYQIECIS